MRCSCINTGLFFIFISSRIVLVIFFLDFGVTIERTILLLAKNLFRISRSQLILNSDYRYLFAIASKNRIPRRLEGFFLGSRGENQQ